MFTTKPYLRIRRPSPTAAEFTVTTLPPLTPALRIALYAVYLVRMLLSCLILLFLYVLWDESPYGNGPGYSTTTTTTTRKPDSRHTHMKTPSSGFYSTDTGRLLSHLLHAILSSPPGILTRYFARRITAPLVAASSSTSTTAVSSSTTRGRYLYLAVILASLAALYALTRRLHTEESLLVLRGLGIQTSSDDRSNVLLRWIGRGATTTTTRFIPTQKIQDILINEAFTAGFGVRYYLVVVVEGERDVVVVFPKLLPRLDVVERVWRGVRECLYERRGGGRGTGTGKGKEGVKEAKGMVIVD
ncbi:hypothetical protein F5Y17DRAFT_303634 [Xylariaceae sp. FL0594]|nr:hypothetical protein F5Y17DRAFT_303634 [Xylariaceae sp. FL0594]